MEASGGGRQSVFPIYEFALAGLLLHGAAPSVSMKSIPQYDVKEKER